MRKFAPLLLTLSSTALASAPVFLAAACAEKPPVTVAVDLLCTETTRYHTTDAQRAAVKADPATWFSLFQWLASFDAVRDKRCGP
jgi:hypothetical protein